LTTEVYSEINPIILTNYTGSTLVGTDINISLSDVGLTPPLAKNISPTLSSFTATLAPTGKGLTGKVGVKSQNHNGTSTVEGSDESFMYWGATPDMTESSLATVTNTSGWGTLVTGRTAIKRLHGFSTGDTPSYSLLNFYDDYGWDAQNTTLNDYDVILVPSDTGDRFVWDNTNWQNYLPGGVSNPNRSGISSGSQYLTIAFCRQNINKFKLNVTGTFDTLYVAAPTAGDGIHTLEEAATSTNGWLDAFTNYGGSGLPGDQYYTNFSLGVRDANEEGPTNGNSGGSYYITLGSANTANANENYNYVILLRFGLTSGDYISSISIEGY
jgi:hypothetical protein